MESARERFFNLSLRYIEKLARSPRSLVCSDNKLIQYQILKTNITRTVWQTLGRITKEILGVKGLNFLSLKTKRN